MINYNRETHLACLSITLLLAYITRNSIQAGFASPTNFQKFKCHIFICVVLGLEKLHVPIVFILGNVLVLDEWHLPICYQNPPFSWEDASTKSGMCCFSVVPLIENSDGWASYRFCLFLWTFPFECALEYGTIVITFIR